MQLFYEGAEIQKDVELISLVVQDSCGDQQDAIDLVFADSHGQWSGWNPRKGDRLEVVQDGYRSGVLWVDRIRQEQGLFSLGAISLPPAARTAHTCVWENITLQALAAEKAAAYGLGLQCFGVQPFPYARVDQIAKKDFAFLQARARLEGCTMKIDGGQVILYQDAFLENQPVVKRLTPAQFLEEPVFFDRADNTYTSCIVRWGQVSGSFADPACIGAQLTVEDVPVHSQREAQRFAQGLLRSYNKREASGEVITALDVSITGGNVIEIGGMGHSDGRWFVELAQHNLAEQQSNFRLHRCLERY